MDYVPLAVRVLHPSELSAPSPPHAMTFAFTAPPYCWLDLGTPVHLHVSPIPAYFPGPCRCPRELRVDGAPAIKGWVVAESGRTAGEVVYVVKNEDLGAATQHALLLFRLLPRFAPPPNSAELAAHRAHARAERVENIAPRGGGPDGPPGRMEGLYGADIGACGMEMDRTGRDELESARNKSRTRAGFPEGDLITRNSQCQRGPVVSRRTAAQPYEIWETYGGTKLSRAARTEAEAVQNYGQPITIRRRGRPDGLEGLMG